MSKVLHLFLIFFKIGLFTFGGGYAMIPMIEQDMLKYNYLTESELIEFIGIAESTPGPFAINIATFAGFKVSGFFGAFFSTLAVVLPSFIIILLIAYFSDKFIKKPIVKNALDFLKPIIIGLIAAAFLNVFLQSFLGPEYLENPIFEYKALIIFGVVLSTWLFYKKSTPIKLVLLSAILGIILYAF